MKHLKIQHLSDNPKKYSTSEQYPQKYRFSKFKLSINIRRPPPGVTLFNINITKHVGGHSVL